MFCTFSVLLFLFLAFTVLYKANYILTAAGNGMNVIFLREKPNAPEQEHYISYYQLFILDIFLRHHAGRQIPLDVCFDAPEKLTADEVLVVSKMMGGHEHFYRRGENCVSFAENSFFLILYGPEN